MNKDRNKLISASEIGTYAFCPRAWALKQLGYPSDNRKQMDSGTKYHHDFGTRQRLIRILWVLVLIILAALAAAVFLHFRK